MNNLAKWKMRLIEWLAGDEPILLGWHFSTQGLKDSHYIFHIPQGDEKMTADEATFIAIMVPLRSIK